MGAGLEYPGPAFSFTEPGLYVAFAAGTGVLPFLDFVSNFATMKCLFIQNKIRFELHVSFKNECEAIALKLLKLVQEYVPETFTAHIRFSEE